MTIAKPAGVGKLLKAVLVGARERTGMEKRPDAIR